MSLTTIFYFILILQPLGGVLESELLEDIFMRKLYAALMGIIIGAAVSLHAQPAWPGGFNGGLSPVQSPPEDSLISFLADLQNLQWVPPDALPSSGTYWVPLNGTTIAPYPVLPQGLGQQVYALPNGTYLVGTTTPASPALLEAQANAVLNLIGQAQTAQANQQMRALAWARGDGFPSPGGGDDGSGGYPAATFTPIILNTNLLWSKPRAFPTASSISISAFPRT